MCTILTTVPRCSKEKLGSETMLSQIMSLVETAQLNRAPVERVADSVARIFVPSIVALSFLTWMTWYLLVYTWEVGSKPWKHLWDEYGQ
jgi:Cu+-exporting ATPase